MLLNGDILEFLFATAATIVATLTGLIGAFSTFRLQNISSELTLLKNLFLDKKPHKGQPARHAFKGEQYGLIEQVYDLNMASIELMVRITQADPQLSANYELAIDIDNIRRNQILYDRIKKLIMNGFEQSLLLVMVSLLLLILTNVLLQHEGILWTVLAIYMLVVGYTFTQFIKQIRTLMS